MPSLRSFATIFCLSFVLFLFGCSASKNVTETQTRLQDIEDAREVNIDSLSTFLGDYRKQDEDEVLYRLEYGMLHHFRANWDSSSAHFQQANKAIERHYTKDVSKNLSSLLTNDLQLPYTGEPYESIYVSTLNCLNYLHKGDVQGGLVEVRKINHKLEMLNDRYKGLASSLMHNKESEDEDEDRKGAMKAVQKVDEKLTDIDLLSRDSDQPVEVQQNSALGRFMATVLYAKNGSSDDARVELENLRTALEDQGDTNFLSHFPDQNKGASQASASSSSGPSVSSSEARPSPDSAAVDIPAESQLTTETAYNTFLVSFTGAPPRKREKSYEFNFRINNEDVQLNFSVPRLEKSGTVVDRVRAVVAGDTLRVPMIENMQSVAESMFQKQLPLLYTRAIMRSFIKAGATEGASEVVENEAGWFAGWLTEQAGEAASKGLAQADTRAWQTMPGYAYAMVAEVPAGEHQVTFEYLPPKDAQETVLRVMKEDGRWLVTTAGIDLVDEIDDVTAINDLYEIDKLNQDEVDLEDVYRTYATREEAVEAARRIGRNHVPSHLIFHNADDSIEDSVRFKVFKRRHHTISVNDKKDLGVAESLYLN